MRTASTDSPLRGKYATTGDAGRREAAQSLDDPGGKILRMTPNGGIPGDNPFPGSLVYSLGHRNPQGIAWDADGNLFAAPEHLQSVPDGDPTSATSTPRPNQPNGACSTGHSSTGSPSKTTTPRPSHPSRPSPRSSPATPVPTTNEPCPALKRGRVRTFPITWT
ncbi:PQQ-dependent sugar dehydrogenase [Microbacterium kribbense]|uniref:PQQ-dependent sugar dehydrogenase n=1 Tax=Microbacterium kribbense TaxID=433645 RepID=UPI003CD0831F